MSDRSRRATAASRGPAVGARELESRLGYRFGDPSLLDQALTHRSWAYEHGGGAGRRDYERLEFLGDALLGFLASEWLWRDDPEATEGTLTRRKQAVVRTDALAAVARRLGLGEAMHLGRGEAATGGREKASLLADVFEAVVGAIFVDGGVRAARAFLRRQIGDSLRGTRLARHVVDDYKTILQEKVQANLKLTPRYRIVSTEGPAHAHEFRVEVLLGGRVVGSGVGPSRKQAEQGAAREALGRLGREEES